MPDNDNQNKDPLEKPVEDVKETAQKVKKTTEKAQETVQRQQAPPRVRILRARLFQVFVLFALVAFFLLAFYARVNPYLPVDLTITRTFQTYHFLGLPQLMEFVSWFGFLPQSPVFTFLTIFVIYMLGFRWESVMVIFATVVSQVLNLLVKISIQRPRPAANLVHVVQQLSSFSFPSGHVMFYTAFYGFLFFLVYSQFEKGWFRTLAMIVFGLMVLLVGPSRIYLGEHWSSDVLGGYLLGGITLALAIQVYQLGKRKGWLSKKS